MSMSHPLLAESSQQVALLRRAAGRVAQEAIFQDACFQPLISLGSDVSWHCVRKPGGRVMTHRVPIFDRRDASDDSIVLIVDDDPIVRGAISSLLQSVGRQVQLFESAPELLQTRLPDVPSCLVLDIRLPGLSGLDLQTELANAGLAIPVIFITGHGDISMSVRAMKAGAIDFLTKPFRDQDLLDAVTRAIERDRKRRNDEKDIQDLRVSFRSLTAREKQIMALVTDGLPNKQVAARTGISEVTTKIHRGRVMKKMGAKSLADLVVMAEALGVRGKLPQETWSWDVTFFFQSSADCTTNMFGFDFRQAQAKPNNMQMNVVEWWSHVFGYFDVGRIAFKVNVNVESEFDKMTCLKTRKQLGWFWFFGKMLDQLNQHRRRIFALRKNRFQIAPAIFFSKGMCFRGVSTLFFRNDPSVLGWKTAWQ
jgi:FixJ family two-component response regulator